MGVEKRWVDCRRGCLRSGAKRKRLVYVARCTRCFREFALSTYQRKLFLDGSRKCFECGCVKIGV